MKRRVALIGYGAIGQIVADAMEIAAVLVRPGRLESTRRALPGATVVTSPDALAEVAPDIVVECAGQGAVAEYGDAVLSRGMDLVVISTGAFADQSVLDRMCDIARSAGCRLLVPAGATAGLDGLLALREGGLESVRYKSSKPPRSWMGTPAEETVDLDTLIEPTCIYEGPAAEAASRFPKNANLAVTIAMAGLGLEDTHVELVADPSLTLNVGRIEAVGRSGVLTVELAGSAAEDNPKTSVVTAHSIIHTLRSDSAIMIYP